MGIKDYLKHIPQEYPLEKSRDYDYVYLDCNYMCHYLIYKCKSDTDLYDKIFTYWDYLISTIKIKKELFLIFDGEYENDELTNPKLQTHLLRAKSKPKSEDYDKQSIGPGSKILKTFREYLLDAIERYKKINKLNFKVTTNSDDVKGEADIKILNTIFKSDQDNICICSKDSDMILISQSICINKSIQIDILSNLRPMKFISVNKFKSYGLDYILIVLFLGNDYLPKISNISYESIIKSYEKYIKFNKPIISNNKINPNNLVNYISCIISNSEKKIKPKLSNINLDRFQIYFNNITWCLSHYKVITNSNSYIQELAHPDDDIKLRNVINIYNFINYSYN
jgi:5'-3' exonuclease